VRRPEPQETSGVELRGERIPSNVRGFLVFFVVIAVVNWVAGPARAQEPGRGTRAAACARGFDRQVQEVLRLRDLDPQSEASRESPPESSDVEPGAPLDARTRLNLAVVITDLLLLRDGSGTAGWPPALRNLSTAELRRRRDAPTLDPVACEIVRFMREHYTSERQQDDDAPEPQRTARATPRPEPVVAPPPVAPPPPPARPTPPAPSSLETAESRVDVGKVRRMPPALVGRKEAGAKDTPVPPRPPESAPARPPEPAPAKPTEPPRAPTPPSQPQASIEPKPPIAPPVVEPRELSEESAALEERSRPPEPPPSPVTPPLPAPEPATDPEPELDPKRTEARQDVRAIEAQLAAPRYLTLRALRRTGESRPDDEVWNSRRATLQAREELVRILRELAEDSARHQAVKALFGREGCARVELAMVELFSGGPGSEDVRLALELWRRQPNPPR
jgi:hypothetical protein